MRIIFQEKCLSCYILLTEQIAWLSLLLDILLNKFIAVFSFPVRDVINFEINLIFLINPFFYMTKKLRQKFKYLENGKNFKHEIKSIFHICQWWIVTLRYQIWSDPSYWKRVIKFRLKQNSNGWVIKRRFVIWYDDKGVSHSHLQHYQEPEFKTRTYTSLPISGVTSYVSNPQ